MSERHTYTERRSYSARVMRFRKAVYDAHDMTNGCRLLLLRLSDDMDSKCIVSVPRSELATDLGVAPARITEWITAAKAQGFLDVVRRGRPGVTAVYQGLRGHRADLLGTPGSTNQMVRQSRPSEVRQGVPPEDPAWYALGGSQEEGRSAENGTTADQDLGDGGSREGVRSDVAPLVAEASTTECPHGMPGGEYPDPFDELSREPSCPACWIEDINRRTHPNHKRRTA